MIHQHARSGFDGMAGQCDTAAKQRDRGFHDGINLADGRCPDQRRAERANESVNAVPEAVDPWNFNCDYSGILKGKTIKFFERNFTNEMKQSEHYFLTAL